MRRAPAPNCPDLATTARVAELPYDFALYDSRHEGDTNFPRTLVDKPAPRI
jgi:hypothetical protein